ncbi:hypothetical protein B0T09DRAFT_28941 [Sordaria sp. MPI-SDFR-AT-0083]|nr:hypothetical protein B0T09DRAFT_28941 [Sordaria sp. MPI-SDFR-AT-0083]
MHDLQRTTTTHLHYTTLITATLPYYSFYFLSVLLLRSFSYTFSLSLQLASLVPVLFYCCLVFLLFWRKKKRGFSGFLSYPLPRFYRGYLFFMWRRQHSIRGVRESKKEFGCLLVLCFFSFHRFVRITFYPSKV